LTDDFAAARAAQWQAFPGREGMAAAPDAFAAIIADLHAFLKPLVIRGVDEQRDWSTGAPTPAPLELLTA
jgi:hypothetical protein